MQLLTHLQPVARRGPACRQALLPRLGIGQLGLQLGDILVLLRQAGGQLRDLLFHAGASLLPVRAGQQCPAREVVPAARQSQFGLALPIFFLTPQRLVSAFQLAALGNAAHRAAAHLHQRILHFLDDQANDLLRVLGGRQQGVKIGIHDVCEA